MDTRGREATGPTEIPRRGWWDILTRVKEDLAEDKLSIIAAGVAFYSFLALFPGLVAMVSIYGLAADPAQMEQQVDALRGVVPTDALTLIHGQLQQVVSHSAGKLGLALAIGIVVALWSAAKGTKALIEAVNIAYDEQERRGFFRLNGTALLLTLGGILFAILTLALVVVFPAALALLQLHGALLAGLSLVRWLLLAGLVVVWLALVYRFAPSREQPRFAWVSPGAVFATALWLIGSAIFSFYVGHFGNYNKTYGSFGAMVVLLMWFWVSVYAVLLGAELNAEMEHQTRRDSTTGPEEPLGERGAHVADTVGKARDDEGGD